MILNPTVATVLDKAAEYVSEVAVMPTATTACGREMGDYGFDAETAVCFAMIDTEIMDRIEMSSGSPHLTEILQVVADFGAVPECHRPEQDAYFQGAGWSLDKVGRRERRRNDVLMWARGLATTEVADLYRSVAEEFRARPEGEGVYDTAGTHEIAESFNNGTWRAAIEKVATTYRRVPELAMPASMALYTMVTSVFVADTTPDPDAGVVVLAEDVTAARVAEIAQGVIDMVNTVGWTDTWLVNPETGAVSIRGAVAAVLDLPPRQDYLNSKLHLTERRWAEFWRFDEAVADYAGIPTGSRECQGCGGTHDNDRIGPWENEGRTEDEIVTILTGVRDTYATIAASDSTGSMSDDDLDLLVREFFGKAAEG